MPAVRLLRRSAHASEETGVQLDLVQARLDELLRRSDSRLSGNPESQISLNEESHETAWWTEATGTTATT